MITEDGKALAERLLDAYNRRAFDEVETLFAPDYVNHNPPPVPGMGPDREGQLAIMRAFVAAFPDSRAEMVHLVAEDDLVVVHDVVRGTHQADFMGIPATGNEARAEFIHIFRVADGKFVERWGLVDGMALMQQLGAAPQGAPA
jgi:steroid delta-isomerase-like uncharacterized protein